MSQSKGRHALSLNRIGSVGRYRLHRGGGTIPPDFSVAEHSCSGITAKTPADGAVDVVSRHRRVGRLWDRWDEDRWPIRRRRRCAWSATLARQRGVGVAHVLRNLSSTDRETPQSCWPAARRDRRHESRTSTFWRPHATRPRVSQALRMRETVCSVVPVISAIS